jgi:hypothetical protein
MLELPKNMGKTIKQYHYLPMKALIEAANKLTLARWLMLELCLKNMGKTIKQYHYLPILMIVT